MAVQTTEEFKNGGATSYATTIEYLKESDIIVEIDGTALTYVTSNPSSGEYTVSGTTVTLGAQAAAGSGNVHIYRETDVNTPAAVFSVGSAIRASDLNAIHDMARFAAVEHRNKIITANIKDGQVTSAKIKDDTIVNADVNASAAIDGTKISPNFGSQNIVTSGTVDGRDVSVDGTKLDGIETGATADQTASEIKTLYEDSGNNNASYIKTQYESNSNTNAYTDAEKTKLTGIETGATADQTGAEIKTAYEAESNTNAFTDAEKTKLSGIATGADVTSSNSINALTDVNTAGVADGKILKYQSSSNSFVIADDGGSSGGGSSTFTGLTDTPANFGNAAGKTLKVNSAGDAVEFVTVSTPAGNFAGLTDTPANFTGGAGKVVKVNSNADGLEFAAQGIVSADIDPELSGGLDVKTYEINTSTTNGNVKLSPNGNGAIEIRGAGGNDGTLQLNCSQNTHGVKIKSPAHSNSASYTLTLPTNINAGKPLVTDALGNLSWATDFVTTTGGFSTTGLIGAFGGIELGSNDTIKFDSDDTDTNHISFKGPTSLSSTVTYTLPEDGSNGQFLKTNGSGVLSFDTIDLTALSASNLTSGTVPDARFPATLPAASAANLTSIPAANITGTLPAIDGSALTGISGAKGGSGEAIFYESENTMDNDYTISTNHNALVAGPLTINATLTVNTNSVVTIP